MRKMASDPDTARYRLHLTAPSDRQHYIDLYRDPEVMRHIGDVQDEARLQGAFDLVCRHNRARLPGHRCWTISDRLSDAFVGITALRRDGERAELGIMLRPDAWNRGVAKEVFGPLLEYAFAAMQLAVVDAERRDDAHAVLIDRLLHPFGFSDSPPTAAGLRRWALHSERWRASADSRRLA
ncbi:RimJ/RimL family protein N-acetyltransferase [Lysobacter sp. HA18]